MLYKNTLKQRPKHFFNVALSVFASGVLKFISLFGLFSVPQISFTQMSSTYHLGLESIFSGRESGATATSLSTSTSSGEGSTVRIISTPSRFSEEITTVQGKFSAVRDFTNNFHASQILPDAYVTNVEEFSQFYEENPELMQVTNINPNANVDREALIFLQNVNIDSITRYLNPKTTDLIKSLQEELNENPDHLEMMVAENWHSVVTRVVNLIYPVVSPPTQMVESIIPEAHFDLDHQLLEHRITETHLSTSTSSSSEEAITVLVTSIPLLSISSSREEMTTVQGSSAFRDFTQFTQDNLGVLEKGLTINNKWDFTNNFHVLLQMLSDEYVTNIEELSQFYEENPELMQVTNINPNANVDREALIFLQNVNIDSITRYLNPKTTDLIKSLQEELNENPDHLEMMVADGAWPAAVGAVAAAVVAAVEVYKLIKGHLMASHQLKDVITETHFDLD